MTEIFILLLIAAVILIGIYFPGWRRRQILARSFPASWKKIVEQQSLFLPDWRRMSKSSFRTTSNCLLQENVSMAVLGWKSPRK